MQYLIGLLKMLHEMPNFTNNCYSQSGVDPELDFVGFLLFFM